MATEITTMTEDEARQFAEATLLDTIRGDMGDFSLRIVRKGGAYTVEMTADPKEGPSSRAATASPRRGSRPPTQRCAPL